MLDLLLKWWPVILAAVGGGFLYLRGRSDGAKGVEAKAHKERVKAIEAANEIQNDVGAMPPDEARKELKTW